MKLLGLAMGLFVLALVGLGMVRDYEGRKADRQSRVDGCERGISDRVVHRDIALAAERGDRAVSEDPGQPARTRLARRDQADEEMRGAIAYESRMPRALRRTKAGRALDEYSCDRVVPAPQLIGK
jgi:hypothetical protein